MSDDGLPGGAGADVAARPEGPAGDPTRHAARGLRHTGLAFAFRLAFGFTVTLVLARLLDPEDFGLLALAVTFTALVQLFRDFGLVNALVRQPAVTEAHLSTAFWLNLAMGAFWALALLACAWPASRFFGEPRLFAVLAVLSGNVFLSAFGGVRRAVMSRQLRFAESARVEVQSTIAGGAVAVALAFAGAGVWSLVAQSFATTLAANVLGWPLVRHRPRLLFSRDVARDLLGFGTPAVGTGLLTYVYRYLDNILIGRFLGAASLGLYDFAYRLFRQPLLNTRQVLTRVMFPTLAAVQGDEERFRALYRRSSRYVSALMVLAFAALHAGAEDLVLGIYGDRWAPSVDLLRILTLAGLFQSLLSPTGWIYQAKGEMGLMFRNSVTWGLLPSVVGYAIGIRWGTTGVAWSVLAVSVFVVYPGLRVPLRLIGLRVRDAARDLSVLLLAAAMAILAAYLVERAGDGLPHLAGLAATGATVVGVYALGLWLGDARLVRDLWRLGLDVAGRRKRRAAGAA